MRPRSKKISKQEPRLSDVLRYLKLRDRETERQGKKDKMVVMAALGGTLMVAGFTVYLTSTETGPALWGKVVAVIGILFVIWATYGFAKADETHHSHLLGWWVTFHFTHPT